MLDESETEGLNTLPSAVIRRGETVDPRDTEGDRTVTVAVRVPG
jgi:hypothetical protein